MQTIEWTPANTGYETDYTHSGRIALSDRTEVLIDKLKSGGFRISAVFQTPCEHGPGVECSDVGQMTVIPGHPTRNRSHLI